MLILFAVLVAAAEPSSSSLDLDTVLSCAKNLEQTSLRAKILSLQKASIPADLQKRAVEKFKKAVGGAAGVRGRNLYFYFRLPGGSKNHSFLNLQGELNQSSFIANLLKTAFPEAQYRVTSEMHSPVPILPGSRIVELLVLDTNEFSSIEISDERRLKTVIPMQWLKPANPDGAFTRRDLVRKLLGIGADERVLHIYTDYGDHYLDTEEIVHWALSPKQGFDRVIFSDKYALPNSNFVTDSWKHFLKSVKGVRLSEALNRQTPLGQLIYNDFRGVMPSLYAASDLAIVIGPFNSFEPLQVGTPIVNIHPRIRWNGSVDQMVVSEREIIESYYVNAFLPDFRVVESAGQGLYLSGKITTHTEKIYELMNRGRIPLNERPFLTAKEGESPFDAVVTRLAEILHAQTRKAMIKKLSE